MRRSRARVARDRFMAFGQACFATGCAEAGPAAITCPLLVLVLLALLFALLVTAFHLSRWRRIYSPIPRRSFQSPTRSSFLPFPSERFFLRLATFLRRLLDCCRDVGSVRVFFFLTNATGETQTSARPVATATDVMSFFMRP